MPALQFFPQKVLFILLVIGGLSAQNCLVLSTPIIAADRTATMHLSLYTSSGPPPAAMQWAFQFLPSSVSSISVDDGPTLTLAGKTAICAGDSSSYKCLTIGANTKTIASGVIAKITVVLAPSATSAAIQISGPMGASSMGTPIPISSRILPVLGAFVSADCKLHTPPKGTSGGK